MGDDHSSVRDPDGRPMTAAELELVAGVDRALAGARELSDWWSAVDAADAYGERFELSTTRRRPEKSFGFLAEANVFGARMPVMGQVQEQLYDRPKPSSSSAAARKKTAEWMRRQVKEFVLRYFMRVGDFSRPRTFHGRNGGPPSPYLRPFSWYSGEESAPPGFGFEQLYYRLEGEERARKFSPDERYAIVDLRELGKTYEWIVVKVDLFDFEHAFGPFGEGFPGAPSLVTEPSYLVLSREFVVEDEPPAAAGEVGRYGFGYAFLPAGEKSLLAHGLGRFEAAFQSICFHVSESGDVVSKTVFVANRPKKVVSVDPVDLGLKMADRFSFGTASAVLEPMQRLWHRMPVAGGVDLVQAFITAANMVTSGGAERSLGVSQKQLHKNFLLAQLPQHHNLIVGSLQIWRQIPDWLDREALPDWVVTGKRSPAGA